MDAIEKVQREFWSWPGPLSEALGTVAYADLMAALAQAWDACYRSQTGLLHDPENPYGGA